MNISLYISSHNQSTFREIRSTKKEQTCFNHSQIFYASKVAFLTGLSVPILNSRKLWHARTRTPRACTHAWKPALLLRVSVRCMCIVCVWRSAVRRLYCPLMICNRDEYFMASNNRPLKWQNCGIDHALAWSTIDLSLKQPTCVFLSANNDERLSFT